MIAAHYRKKIYIITFMLFIITVLFLMDFGRVFWNETSKSVNFNLNGDLLTNRVLTIEDGEIVLPYPAQVGYDTKVGETFLGYDINNDGEVDYQAGDSVLVASNSSVMNIGAVVLADNVPFTAWLYDDSTYESGVELTELGSVSTPWNYLEPLRYLVIQPNFTEAAGGTIEIKLPVGMQWYDGDTDITTTTWTPAIGNILDASFTKLSGLSGTGGQGAGVYFNNRTGTLTYTYSSLSTLEDFIVIPVTFDYNIWNKDAMINNNITGDFDPITVVMTEGSSVYTKKLNEVEFSNNRPYSVDTYYAPKTVGTKYEVDLSTAGTSVLLGYYKEISVEFHLPTDGVDYARYIREDTNTFFNTNYYKDKWIMDTSDPTKIVFTAYDIYISTSHYVSPIVIFDEDKFEVGDNVTYGYTLNTTSYGDVEYTSNKSVSATIIDNVKVEFYGYSRYIYENEDDEVESTLGYMTFVNKGLENSNPVEIKYLFDTDIELNSNERNIIDVTSMYLPQNGNVNYDVNYVLIDEYSNEVGRGVYTDFASHAAPGTYGYTASFSIPKVVADYNLKNPDNQLDPDVVSFKEISYKMDYIKAATSYYCIGAPQYVGCPGTYYGQHNLSGERAMNTIVITEEIGVDQTEVTSKNYFVSSTASANNSLSIENINISESQIQAGESLRIESVLNMMRYPYGYSLYSENPELYYVLPDGLTIDESSILAMHKGLLVTPMISSKFNAATNETIYTISFNEGDVGIGGPFFDSVGNLNRVDLNNSVSVFFNVDTDPAMNLTLVDLFDISYIGENGANVTYSAILEPYDFDGNGILDKRVGHRSISKTVTIMPNTNVVEFENEISINGGAFTSDDYSYIVSDSNGNLNEGTATYKVTVENNFPGIVAGEDFYHYIPIPKAGIVYPNQMGIDNNMFNFELSKEVIISGDNGDIYKVLYTDSTDLVDGDGNIKLTDSDWKEFSTIADITKVTMIKITGIKNSMLNSYTEDFVSLQLDYKLDASYDNSGYYSGSVVKFNSYGWQKYLPNGFENTTNVHTFSNDVQVMLRYATNYEEEILASYDEVGNKLEFQLPKYFENKNISILDVKEYNLDLVNSSVIDNNKDLTNLNTVNNTFGVKASLNNGSVVELASFNNSPLYLGTLLSDNTGTITFDITSYNRLLDVSSSKYIEIYIGDNLGIKYCLKLDVKRKSLNISSVDNTIAEGSHYKIISNDVTSISVVQNSSITAQFSNLYDYNTYDNLSLKFSSMLPVGTKIKMIDVSEVEVDGSNNYTSSPLYYYYEVGTTIDEILVTDFKNMSDNSNYVNSDQSLKSFVFVIEFDSNYLAVGNYNVSMGMISNSGSDNYTSGYNIEITKERELSITPSYSKHVVNNGEMNVKLEFSNTVGSGVDTEFQNFVLALKVEFEEALSSDAYLELVGNLDLVGESNRILKYNDYFLIPLGNAGDFSTVEYIFHSGVGNLSSSNINHSLVKYDEPEGEIYATNKVAFTVNESHEPALLIELDGVDELILYDSVSSIPFKFNYIDYDNQTNFTTRLYIWEKVDGTYIKQNNLIENAVIDGTLVKPVNDIIVFNPDDLKTESLINLNLIDTSVLPNRTYRVVIETNHLGVIKYTDYTNFIVVTD